MKVRRIVTGHDGHGKSIFVADGDAPRERDFKAIPGHGFAQVWATTAGATVPHRAGDPTADGGSLLPGHGASSLLVVAFPPDSVMASPSFDGAAAGVELAPALPGLIECFEPDCPGMHTTDTIDYGIVLDGELWLELDDGAEKKVRRGDIVVQNGTRHAWRNRTGKVATVAFVLIGAVRT